MSTIPLSADPAPITDANDERRLRLRLRELCDEVLASQRVAEGRDVLTAEERQEARTLLSQFAPRAGMRERVR